MNRETGMNELLNLVIDTRLTEKQRKAVRLRWFEEKSLTETAEEMGKKYAAVISAAVAGETGIRDRGAKVKFNAKGKDYFAILRETECTALLVETGFIDSAVDGALFETSVFRDRCAKAIAKAVSEASGKENFLVKITTPSLNIRSGPGVNYPWRGLVREDTVLTITDTRGAWGRLKSGAGWISLSPEYVRRLGNG